MAKKRGVDVEGMRLPRGKPQRTKVPEKAAQAFEESPAPAKMPRPAASKKRSSERGERVVAYLPAELEAELRMRCVRDRCSLTHAVSEAVQLWLEERRRQNPM